jgi:hypothetical protein
MRTTRRRLDLVVSCRVGDIEKRILHDYASCRTPEIGAAALQLAYRLGETLLNPECDHLGRVGHVLDAGVSGARCIEPVQATHY